jgi:hypothetical protein
MAGMITASAAQAGITQGVGVGVRFGAFAGLASGGGALTLRLDKLGLEGGVLTGRGDVASELGSQLVLGESSATVDKAEIRQTAGYAMLKFHPMNGSFYFGASGVQTKATAVLNAHANSGETIEEKMSVERTLTFVSVGNTWTPGGVMLGVEWGGFGVLQSAKKTNTGEAATYESDDLQQIAEDFRASVDRYCGGSSFNALVVSFGLMLGR